MITSRYFTLKNSANLRSFSCCRWNFSTLLLEVNSVSSILVGFSWNVLSIIVLITDVSLPWHQYHQIVRVRGFFTFLLSSISFLTLFKWLPPRWDRYILVFDIDPLQLYFGSSFPEIFSTLVVECCALMMSWIAASVELALSKRAETWG